MVGQDGRGEASVGLLRACAVGWSVTGGCVTGVVQPTDGCACSVGHFMARRANARARDFPNRRPKEIGSTTSTNVALVRSWGCLGPPWRGGTRARESYKRETVCSCLAHSCLLLSCAWLQCVASSHGYTYSRQADTAPVSRRELRGCGKVGRAFRCREGHA